MRKNIISTYKKLRFNPTEAIEKDIDIEDIAHALSMLCRANGHINNFYSVAQHSICCALEAEKRGYSKRVQLLCLLHDASEAYIGDMVRPLKIQIPQFSIFEDKLERTILSALNIEYPDEEELKLVKAVDDSMLYNEFKLMHGDLLFDEALEINITLSTQFRSFKEVEAEFLKLYNKLK